jgi:hypothetical protein
MVSTPQCRCARFNPIAAEEVVHAALVARWVIEVRDGAQDDAVDFASARQHVIRQGGSAALVDGEADLLGLEIQAEAEPPVGLGQHCERG